MNIPDKAVENAVEAFNEAHMDGYGEDPTDAIRDALTAAAPFIAAQAWEEGREALALDCTRPVGPDGMRPSTPNPYGDPQ